MSAFLKANFAKLAPFLVDYGYSVVPIRPGAKAPMLDSWQDHHPPQHYLPKCAAWGTGILTRHCPAVDLDIRDKELVRVLIDLADELLGPSPFRVGSPPKALLPFSTAEPFAKLYSPHYALPGEDWLAAGYSPHRIEILGDGQQFVSYARHPRGSLYRWCRGEPMDTVLIDLPEIDHDSATAFLATAQEMIAGYGGVALRRYRGAWEVDMPRPERERHELPPDSSWQNLDPEDLADLVDAAYAKRQRNGWLCSCPAHSSQGHRSLSITPRDGGGSVVHCFAGCPFPDIAREISSMIGRRAA